MTSVVWAVVTTFEPDASLADALASIRAQVDEVVVVDDGSGAAADPVLAALSDAGTRVVRLETNSGIAVALNRGIRTALDAGADAVVTFDQDSRIGAGFVSGLLAARAAAASEGLSVGPVVPERFAAVSQVHGATAGGTLLARHVIQSGMLLDRETIREVGGMFEPLFIDLVDTEYELRCIDHGRVVVAAGGTSLEHSLGASLPASWWAALPGADAEHAVPVLLPRTQPGDHRPALPAPAPRADPARLAAGCRALRARLVDRATPPGDVARAA